MKIFDRFFAIFGYRIFYSNFFLGVVNSGEHGESLKIIKRATFFPVNLDLNDITKVLLNFSKSGFLMNELFFFAAKKNRKKPEKISPELWIFKVCVCGKARGIIYDKISRLLFKKITFFINYFMIIKYHLSSKIWLQKDLVKRKTKIKY